MTTTAIRFAGFGGQGIVKLGEIFGAAAVRAGKNALQNQSYGSSARGGLCTADVTVADGEILDIEPERVDVLAALSQDSADAYLKMLKPGGLLITEAELVDLPADHEGEFHAIAATSIAAKELNRRIVTNMVLLGFMAALSGLVDRESLEETIRANVPRGTEDLNLKAFKAGWDRAS
jgi:2-oxoglutarate ferredoxin oxidoreductase subunit gamma